MKACEDVMLIQQRTAIEKNINLHVEYVNIYKESPTICSDE